MESLPQSLAHIISLKRLLIGWCTELRLLPESLGELRSLQRLEITGLDALTCLPQSIRRLSSLEELSISYCPLLTSLPEQIRGLTALQQLGIYNCPDLKRRYDRNKVDWGTSLPTSLVYILMGIDASLASEEEVLAFTMQNFDQLCSSFYNIIPM